MSKYYQEESLQLYIDLYFGMLGNLVYHEMQSPLQMIHPVSCLIQTEGDFYLISHRQGSQPFLPSAKSTQATLIISKEQKKLEDWGIAYVQGHTSWLDPNSPDFQKFAEELEKKSPVLYTKHYVMKEYIQQNATGIYGIFHTQSIEVFYPYITDAERPSRVLWTKS